MRRNTPVRTSARSSASSTARSRTIPVEVAVELRPAQPADLPAIQSIYAHHVLQGLASFEEEPPSAEELGRRYRDVIGRGVGKRLLDELIRRCEVLGYRQIIAVIGDSANQASIGVHAACGFLRVGTLRSVGFKFGRWVDSVYMQRPLGRGDATQP